MTTLGYFILRGTVTERGKLKFPVVTRNEDGSSSVYDGDAIGDPHGAQLVFAGVEPKDSDYSGAEGGGRDRGRFLAFAAAISSILGGVALLARNLGIGRANARAATTSRDRPVGTVRRRGRQP